MNQVWVPEKMIFGSASEALSVNHGAAVSLHVFNDIQNLKKQNEILIEALEFYADKYNWNENNVNMREWYLIESTDRGDKAREALAQIEKMRG